MVRFFFVITALFVSVPALAQRVQLSLQATEVEALQTVGLVVSVIDYKRAVRPPSLVVHPDVTVEFSTDREGMEMSGQGIVRTVQFIYAATPQREGTFTLGPADIVVDGVTLTTNSVQLTVKPRTLTADTPELEAYAEFEQTEVYEGQIVLYRYGLRSRRRIYRDQWVRPPMARLQSPRDGLPVTTEYVIDDPTGPLYVKQNHQALLATAPGDLGQIPATAIVSLAVGSPDRFRIRRTQDVTIVTDPSPLTVLSLPPAPPGFTGLVGDFEFTGSLNRTRVRAGDSVTFTVDVVGDGSLEGFALPEAPEVDGVSFYDNMVGADARISEGKYVAQGRWQRVIVGTKRGVAQVPPVSIVSFSPSRQRYVTHELVIEPITVRPGDESEADVESFSEADSDADGVVIDTDIRPIYRAWRASTLPTLPWLLGAAVLLGLPGLWVAVSSGVGVLRRRREGRERPVDSPLVRLRGVAVGDPERLAVLDATLRACLANCTPDGQPSSLPDDSLAADVRAALAELGRVRFAGGVLPEDLDSRAVALCTRLDGLPEVTS